MKRLIAGAALPLAAVLLAGCGAPPPADFGSNWTALNQFRDTPQEVPLVPAYVYYASPMDGTLRGMLRRWADDNAMPLVWQLNSDYTLHKAVARLRATSLQAAANELNQIYTSQGVSITVDTERILVRLNPPAEQPASPVDQPASAAAPALPPKGTSERSPQPDTNAAAVRRLSTADGVLAEPVKPAIEALDARPPNDASARSEPEQSAPAANTAAATPEKPTD
jgi:hypothetical protein